jgi:lysophospholipase L1-like esterase
MKKSLLLFSIFFLFSSFSPIKKITWVAIGDSITYLNDHKNETGNRVTKGYMTLVTEKLPHIEFINQGHNGWTSGGIADKIETLNLTKADVYSIFLGTNDWWAGRPLGTFADYENNTGNATVNGSFRLIVNKLRSLNKDAKIILITPMQRLDFVYIASMKNNAYGSYKEKKGQMLSQFADAINKIGAFEHFDVVDLYNTRPLRLEKLVKFKRLKDPKTGNYTNYKYPKFIDVPFNPETDEYPYPLESVAMTYDGLHPSDKGYKVIAKMLVKVLKKY